MDAPDPRLQDPDYLAEQLYALCDHELSHCNPAVTPHICRAQSTPETLQGLREKIVRVALRRECSIQDAIVEVEREFDFNPDLD